MFCTVNCYIKQKTHMDIILPDEVLVVDNPEVMGFS